MLKQSCSHESHVEWLSARAELRVRRMLGLPRDNDHRRIPKSI